MGAHLMGIHGEGDFYDIACLPRARKEGVAVLKIQFCRLSVDRQLYGLCLAVEVGVEVGVYGSVLCPSGDAQFQGELACVRGVDGQAHASLPGIVGLLGETDGFAVEGDVGGVAHLEVNKDVVGRACGIDVAWNGGNEAAEVGGAAGGAEPLAALLPTGAGFEAVGVVEAVAVERETIEHGVVERALEDVDVAGITRQAEHTELEHAVGHTGAGLAVGRGVG